MKINLFTLLFCFGLVTINTAHAQTTENAALGAKPTIKIESLSPAGHCDNQQVSFFAPWADHYEIAKRRIDTAWIKDSRAIANWSSQVLKPHVNAMIYKRLDERGTYQFVVKAWKGDSYRVSDTLTLPPCIQ